NNPYDFGYLLKRGGCVPLVRIVIVMGRDSEFLLRINGVRGIDWWDCELWNVFFSRYQLTDFLEFQMLAETCCIHLDEFNYFSSHQTLVTIQWALRSLLATYSFSSNVHPFSNQPPF